jgi:hypothetical protein
MKALLTALLFVPQICIAANIKNLSEDFPLSIEDATPTEVQETQFQISADYVSEDDDEYLLKPDFEYGLTKDIQLDLGTEMIQGTSNRNGSGDIFFGALWLLPVDFTELALKGTLIAPTGIESQGVDHELGLISSLHLGADLRTHLDLRWLHNAEAKVGEREDGFRTGFGLQHIYNDQTSSLISFVREVELEADQEFNLIELGALHSLGEYLAGGAAVGVGIGDNSPDFISRLGLQQEF